ncbi:hypothetical protein [Legionella brunensis]|uniref:SdhA, substrate of the Dot/Icm system n=1 Tax=Legionella brunensis TaxID=29422 RepID=A0A0W0S018_9GAMM|nr:hypothetical protein [Legionella brunensis]KTC76815.1 SdhA, substrate of the Dot/Icm system [Legionella brunensis]
MIERYLRLLDNFKEQDIAKFLKDLQSKILLHLDSRHFSDKIKPFFRIVNTEGEPFSNFAAEPKQIVQIKQVINALYHAQLAFEDLQSVNFRDRDKPIADLKRLYWSTIEHGYTASYLLTHLDIDFNEILGSEIQQAIKLLEPIKAFADEHKDGAIEFTSTLKNYPIGNRAGWASGIAIAQMKPNGGNYDYDFLAHFGAVLPGYIQQLTLYLQHYGPQISTYQPTIDKAKLDDLQEEAFKLLKSIENLQSGDIFLSFKAINYIRIVREIITLSMSSLEQIGYANESSQQVVRHNMRKLKYDLLPTLFSLADRIEDQALLTPGTLSTPMLTHIKPLYELLGIYASKIVDFSVEGEELLAIEDAHFIETRLEHTRERIAAAKWDLTKQQLAQKAFTSFFLIIDNPEYTGYSLLNLPQEIKESLKSNYKLLLPYIKRFNPELANLITRDLVEENTLSRQFLRPWHWLTGTAGPVAITSLEPLKTQLQSELTKDEVTQKFHIALNEDIIKFVHTQSNTSIFPYQEKSQLKNYDEAKVLGVDPKAKEQQFLHFKQDSENVWVGEQAALTFEQTQMLYRHYEKRESQLGEAFEAFQQFLTILAEPSPKPLHKIKDAKLKEKLRGLYSLFQPYFIESQSNHKQALQQDKAIIDILSENSLLPKREVTKAKVTIDCFTPDKASNAMAHIICSRSFCSDKAQQFKQLAEQKYLTKIESQVLSPDKTVEQRENFLIKHTNYSQAVASYRDSLFQLTDIFNKALKQKLQPSSKGIPFPEIENDEQSLSETKQSIAIKRIFNSLYHLEQICLELEKLNQKSYQTTYVYHLIQAKSHIDELVHHTQNLIADPHFSLLATELKDKALVVYHAFLEQKDTYAVGSDDVDLQHPKYQDRQVKYTGLWYTLHTFMLIPEHVKALVNNKNLSEETKAAVNLRTKKAAINIEGIIDSSNSYFKLFLETPTMYRLYRELKVKLTEFTQLSHEAAIAHLEELNGDLFVRILTEADQWEEKLGLKPGLLADPMKAVLDEFHQGLLEPLGLKSQEHIALVSNLAPICERLESAKTRKRTAEKKLFLNDTAPLPEIKLEELTTDKYAVSKASLVDKYTLINALIKEMKGYVGLHYGLPANPLVVELNEQRLLKLYTAALPILLEEKKHLLLPFRHIEGDYRQVENFLQSHVKPPPAASVEVPKDTPKTSELTEDESYIEMKTFATETASGTKEPLSSESVDEQETSFVPITAFISLDEPKKDHSTKTSAPPQKDTKPAIANIKQLASAVLAYYQGCNNSIKFEIETLDERINYLEELKDKQEELSTKFIEEYTQKAFARELRLATSRHIGLLHMRDEYNQALKDYLQTTAIEIMTQSKSAQDIDAEIKRLLGARVREFDRINFPKYVQFEGVRSVLEQFNAYFSKTNQAIQRGSSFFESAGTLDKKIQIIDGLSKIASNRNLSVEKRLADIKAEVKKGSFITDMLAYHHYDTFSFAWLAQCVISLLSALHLYTPKHKLLMQRLEDAVTTPVSQRAALRRFSIFETLNPTNVRAYDLPPPVVPDNEGVSLDNEDAPANAAP